MAIIYSYPPNNNILSTDILVCTSTALVGGKPKNQTKSLSIANLSTYIITSPSNNLNQVLTNGNTSLLDAKIGELYLFDTSTGAYAKMSVSDQFFELDRAGGGTMLTVDNGNNLVLNNGTASAQIINPLTISRNYTLPDKSGTFALTSDIPIFTPTLQEVCNVGATVINVPILLEDLSAPSVLSVFSETGVAILGQSAEGFAVRGGTDIGYGIYGSAQAGYGGYFTSDNGPGGFFSSGETYSLIAAQSAAKPGGGSWSVYSDSRIKENIVPYTKGLSDILLINPVTYEYNGLAGTTKGKKYTGIIAQEIKEVFPETVNTYKAKLNEDDEEKTELYDFNSSDLTFALINAVKELSERIAILENK